MLRIDPVTLDWLRAFAKEPEALMMPLRIPNGRIVLWADDINAARTDVELIELIQNTARDAYGSSARTQAGSAAANISVQCA